MADKILIVEDTATTRRLHQLILEGAGYEVLTATDGQEGLSMAKSQAPDLILMDIQMPIMNGLECCQALKANEKTKSIKIVMVTAEEHRDQVHGAFAVGCDGYITKPVDSEDLKRKVGSLLRLARARRQLKGLF